jgi:hypothetical protein
MMDTAAESPQKQALKQHVLHYWQGFRQQGLRFVRTVFGWLILVLGMVLSNLLLFIWALSKVWQSGFGWMAFPSLVGIVLVGIVSTGYVGWQAYCQGRMALVRSLYEAALQPFFAYICQLIAEQLVKLVRVSTKNPTGTTLVRHLQLPKLLKKSVNRFPVPLQRAIKLVFILAPLERWLTALADDIHQNKVDEPGQVLYEQLDTFLYENIFPQTNNTGILMWWAVNIGLVVLLVWLGIGI